MKCKSSTWKVNRYISVTIIRLILILVISIVSFTAKSQKHIEIDGLKEFSKLPSYTSSNLAGGDHQIIYHNGTSGIKKMSIKGDSGSKKVKSISNSINISYNKGEVSFGADLSIKGTNEESQVGLFLKLYDEKNNLLFFDNLGDVTFNNNIENKRFKVYAIFDKPISKIDWGFFISGKGKIEAQNITLEISKSEFSKEWKRKYSLLSKNSIECKRLASFAEIWGFLKYHHPVIADNLIDWDSVAVNNIYPILNVNNNKEYNNLIIGILDRLGPVESTPTPSSVNDSSLLINYDSLDLDRDLLDRETIDLLTHIERKYVPIKNYYVKESKTPNPNFTNETSYKFKKLPSIEYRLLALFRYWNAVNYFYPYKYALVGNWKDVLDEFIPMFVSSKTEFSYKRSLLLLNSQINDSHASIVEGIPFYELPIYSDPTEIRSGLSTILPWQLVPVNNYAIVKDIDSKFELTSGISKGTKILKINAHSVDQILSNYHDLISAAKIDYKNFIIEKNNFLSYSNSSTDSLISIEYQKNNDIIVKSFKYEPNDYQTYFTELFNDSPKLNTHQLNDSILYINPSELDSLSLVYIDSVLSKIRTLIIDFRQYPNYTYTGKLLSKIQGESRPGVRFQWIDVTHPGVLLPYSNQYWPTSDAVLQDRKNIITLIDETSISQSEFWAMLFREISTNNNVIIGRPSAGANGDVSKIVVPGEYYLRFSGIRVNHINGGETFKIGIQPDYFVPNSEEAIVNSRDLIYDKAIELAKNGYKTK